MKKLVVAVSLGILATVTQAQTPIPNTMLSSNNQGQEVNTAALNPKFGDENNTLVKAADESGSWLQEEKDKKQKDQNTGEKVTDDANVKTIARARRSAKPAKVDDQAATARPDMATKSARSSAANRSARAPRAGRVDQARGSAQGARPTGAGKPAGRVKIK